MLDRQENAGQADVHQPPPVVGRQVGDRPEAARACGVHADVQRPGHPGVPVGRVDRRRFVPEVEQVDSRVPAAVEEGVQVTAVQGKDHRCDLGQGLGQQRSAVQVHSRLLVETMIN
jgi:hypothetical protein